MVTTSENQPGRAKIIHFDSAQGLNNKICRLRKEIKFTNKKYFELDPSHSISSRLYRTITEAATGGVL